MNLIGEAVKRAIPWAKIGELTLTATAATITAIVQRRNQERMIEQVGAKVAKKVIEHQEKAI